jgi:hypothetical protein
MPDWDTDYVTRGACSSCGVRYELKGDGTLRHQVSSRFRVTCPGTDLPPADPDDAGSRNG